MPGARKLVNIGRKVVAMHRIWSGQSMISRILEPLIIFLLFVLIYVVLKVYIYGPTANNVSYTDNNYNVLGLNIPANMQFCGEKIPSNDLQIKRHLDREFYNNAYWKNNSLSLFRKAQRWFPYIEPILKQEGIPDDFKYLAVIESHLSNALSPAGAAGFWQLVPVSARNYGLEVNDEIDERYHVEKATRAACAHIREAYGVFKNWTLSAAAYNRGIGGIQKAMQKQGMENYYDLMLNPETGSFVYRILAYKTLFSNPGHFGLKKRKWSYLPKIAFRVYKVDSSVHDLGHFAKHVGTTAGTIRLYNPWILKAGFANAARKVYEIRVPRDKEADYSGYVRDLLAEAGNLATYADNPLVVADMPVDSIGTRALPTYHVVKVDEPLKDLAAFLSVKEEDLCRWNGLEPGALAVKGQTLVVFHKTELKLE